MLQELRKISNKKASVWLVICAIVAIAMAVIIWNMGFPQLFEKPVNLNTIKDEDIAPGRAEMDIYFVVDYYASYEEDGNTTRKYYLVPVGEQSYIGVEAQAKYFDELDPIMAVSQDYLMGNRDNVEGSFYANGTISEMTGEELQYYKAYYSELDWGSEDIFLPYTLRLGHYGEGTSFTFIFFGAILLCVLIGMIVIVVNMSRGKYQKMITDYCKKAGNNEQAMYKVEQFYNTTQPIHGFRISKEYVMTSNGANTVFFEGKELLWAYMDVTNHYTYFIKTGTTYAIQLRMRGGKSYVISVKNEQMAQEVLKQIHDKLPFVFVGYSDEVNGFYNKNRAEMIQESEKMRAEMMVDLPENGVENAFREW